MGKLPILMYHNVTTDFRKVEGLTISVELLERQFQYLSKRKFKTHHFSDLEQINRLSGRNVILTFDDVTVNQLQFAIPLLKKYNFKATFFVPFAFLGGVDGWNSGRVPEPIMSIEELKSLGGLIELGYHSYLHRPYGNLSDSEIDEDFSKCFALCEQHNLKMYPVLAYPYGNFPKKEPEKSIFFEKLKSHNIRYGLRIGNKVNRFPFQNPYEVKRLDIRGDESLWAFKYKLYFGKIF